MAKSPLITELGKTVHQNTMICQRDESQQHALYTNLNVCFFNALRSRVAFMFSDQCSVKNAKWNWAIVPTIHVNSKDARRKKKKRSAGCGLLLRINIKDV